MTSQTEGQKAERGNRGPWQKRHSDSPAEAPAFSLRLLRPFVANPSDSV